MRSLALFLFVSCFLWPVAGAVHPSWLVNYQAGLKKASEEKKNVLVCFMGPDSHEQCQAFSSAVLTDESFLETVSEHFVLVMLDFPKSDPQLKERNERLRLRYKIKEYPVLLLLDEAGDPYGEVRYRPKWKVADYVDEIERLADSQVTPDKAGLKEESNEPEPSTGQGVVKTESGISEKETKTTPSRRDATSKHQRSLQNLEVAHKTLATAEEAFAKAEANLLAAREGHEQAHRAEAASRKLIESEKAELEGKPAVIEPDALEVEIESFEKRARELKVHAQKLRENAKQLRKEDGE